MSNTPGDSSNSSSPRARIRRWAEDWEDLDEQIKELTQGTNTSPTPESVARLDDLRRRRKELSNNIVDLVEKRPQLANVAVNNGFNGNLLGELNPDLEGPGYGGRDPDRNTGGNGDGTPSVPDGEEPKDPKDPKDPPKDPGGGTEPSLSRPKLPGVRGKDYTIIRNEKGVQFAVYKIKVKGNTVPTMVQLPRNEKELGKYGIKKGDGRLVDSKQLKKYQNLGFAEEILKSVRKDDRNPFKSMIAGLERQYEGSSILRNDEVMGVVIANSIMGWAPGEFENQLKQTKWYSNTTALQRGWQLDYQDADREAITGSTKSKVIAELENIYGYDWAKHVDPSKVDIWAKNLASGRWGAGAYDTIGAGIEAWARGRANHAAGIEGTNEAMRRRAAQEEENALANRPEDRLEQLRGDAIKWLGYSGKEAAMLDHDTLMGWANDLTAGTKSDGDWMTYLRQQKKALYKWLDPDETWTDGVSAYKARIEGILNTTVSWDDPLLRGVGGSPDNPQERTSINDFEKLIRNDERAWQEGTQLHSDGLNTVAQLVDMFKGGF